MRASADVVRRDGVGTKRTTSWDKGGPRVRTVILVTVWGLTCRVVCRRTSHQTVVSRYGSTIEPKVLGTSSMRRGEAAGMRGGVRMTLHQIVSEECIARVQQA